MTYFKISLPTRNWDIAYLIHELSWLPFVSPGNVPARVAELGKQAEQFILPTRRERSYPRWVKARPQKYAIRKPNKNNASQR